MEAQWKARLREIRHEQRQTDLIIPPIDFARAVYHTSTDVFSQADQVAWTDEALELLQTACEASMLRLATHAVYCMINGDRRVVAARDIVLAAGFMGLRD